MTPYLRSALTLGLVSLRLGLPTSLSPQVENLVQLLDNDPNNPIFTQRPLDGSGIDNNSTYNLPEGPGDAGSDPHAAKILLAEANNDNVPVDNVSLDQIDVDIQGSAGQ